MRQFRSTLCPIVLLVLLAAAPAARAGVVITPPRPGQVGIGVQGQFGTLLEGGSLGNGFSSGGGLAVRVRYRMRYERAIGVSFENHGFDARPGATFHDLATGDVLSGQDVPTHLNLILSGIDFYQMFGTETPVTRMVGAGIGIAQAHRTAPSGTDFPPDGFYITVGGGIEKFFYRSIGVDASLRYHAIFTDGSTNHDLQASLGLILYAAY